MPIDESPAQKGREGMRCHDCGEKHSDWEHAGEYAVSDGHNEGIITRLRCEHCGGITEGGRK